MQQETRQKMKVKIDITHAQLKALLYLWIRDAGYPCNTRKEADLTFDYIEEHLSRIFDPDISMEYSKYSDEYVERVCDRLMDSSI